MPYKVALVANSTWNFFNFRLNIIRSLKERGYEVVLISPPDQYLAHLLEVVEVKHIPLNSLDRKSVNPFGEMALYREFKRIYRNEAPDLILHYTIKPNIYGNMAAKKLGIHSICVITGLGYVFLHDNIYNSVAKRLYRKSLHKADLVVFENAEDKDLFVQLALAPAEKTSVVNGCGINLEYFKPISYPEKSSAKTVFTFIARLILDKGIMEFIEAAKSVRSRYPYVEFWVAGEIDEGNPTSISHETLYEWVESGVIKYFGHVRDVRPIIAKSDCIVLPSYREAMARTLTEALAMEKPVISCDTGGCRTIVDDGVNGYLVPVKDVDALVHAFETFKLLPEISREKMGKSGREKAISEFDEEIVTSQFIKLIDGLNAHAG